MILPVFMQPDPKRSRKRPLKMQKAYSKGLKSERGLEEVRYLTPETVFDQVKQKFPGLYTRISAKTPEGELARVLMAWRLLKNRQQIEVAKMAGCSRATYQNMENAKKGVNPGYLTLWRIAESYGLSIQEFMVGPGKAGRLST
jgi:DNA-binding XRE family transcriptional regulator